MRVAQRTFLVIPVCLLVAASGGGCDGPRRPGSGANTLADSDGGTTAGTGGARAGAAAGGKSGAGAGAGAGTATAGVNGTAGSGGRGGQTAHAGAGAGGKSGAAGGGGSPSSDPSDDVLERNKRASRDGHFVQPTLTKANAAKFAKDADFAAAFDGKMWASPLYVGAGPDGHGAFFAVTTNNDVFALDETTGSQLWMHHLGDSPTGNGVGCGNIHPLGILSTPVIDVTARTIYVAGAIGTSAIARHEVHALSLDDGSEREGWPIDVSKIKAGSVTFNSPAQNQRSALSLVAGKLYVAYGGHVGDCGDYHGWVVGIDTANPSQVGAWASLSRGDAIWAAGGLASDGNGVFAVTGNSTANATLRTETDSEQVVRITGLGSLDRDDKNLYFPTTWRTMDQQDADFGANNPVYITVPGATPANYVAALAKDGHLYLLDSTNLGGMGGHIVDLSISSGSMSVRTVPTAYTTSQGTYLAFSTVSGAKCPSGGASGTVMMGVRITKGSPLKAEVAWCAKYGGGETGPITTTTDGTQNPLVWFMDQGKLTAVDGDTGESVWNSGSETCNAIRKWTSPIAVKGRIVVGGDGHLCSWSAR